MTFLPTWLAALTLCGGGATAIPWGHGGGTTVSIVSHNNTSTTPTCDPSNPLFIMQPQGSSLYFAPSWNASLGGFQLVAAVAKPSDATVFFLDSECDYSNGPQDPICDLTQIAFNYTCPGDEEPTTYRAWTFDSFESAFNPAPVTFFDAKAAEALVGNWYMVLDFGDAECEVDMLVWGDHDFSDPFLVEGKLWAGGSLYGDDAIVGLEKFAPVPS